MSINDSDIEVMSDKELGRNISLEMLAIIEGGVHANIRLDNLRKLLIELKKRGII